ncbi:hypothetical protein QTO34_004928 [Cnephaeus nilssonii]|uniref:TRAF-type domain-containing protein n=1 Tax=Cnephaeus nilssonii TaxID=3371016 RepID=A0AA40LIH5_CNENI|nr:hypothetical protein QTO34_004928 [Eptesicus nilssonii]
MAAASVTPPGSLDVLQPGFSKTLLGTKLEDKYLCSACKNVLRRPFQAQCGHRYCSFCLSTILRFTAEEGGVEPLQGRAEPGRTAWGGSEHAFVLVVLLASSHGHLRCSAGWRSGPQNCAACVHEGIYEEGISILESSSAFPDNAARREVESLPAICSNDGCAWKGTLKEYEAPQDLGVRLPVGSFAAEQRPEVGLTWVPSVPDSPELPRRTLPIPADRVPGVQRPGPPRREGAPRGAGVPREEPQLPALPGRLLPGRLKAHHEVCPKFPVTCEGWARRPRARKSLVMALEGPLLGVLRLLRMGTSVCLSSLSPGAFQDHLRTCGKCPVPCRFHDVGCPEMVSQALLESPFPTHGAPFLTPWPLFASTCPLPGPQVESEKQQEHELQRLREHLTMLLHVLLEAKRPPLGPGEAGGWEVPQAVELLQRCEALEKKTATFENIVCVLNREVERVAMTAEACGRQHRLDQDRIKALSNKVQQLERSIGLKDLAMADLEQKVQEMEASTFDGVFVWKISDFARKRQEAVAGRTPAIFSPVTHAPQRGHQEWQLHQAGLPGQACSCVHPTPRCWLLSCPFHRRVGLLERSVRGGDVCPLSVPGRRRVGLAPTSPLLTPNPAAFYTSRYGYKMCLRVYLNGDGTGRGTHLSLFFVVMKGPNDALLRWPFNQKVRELPCAAVGQSLRGEGAGTGAGLLASGVHVALSPSVTLMLLDQNNREHVIDAFRPDVTSSSFQRPVSDMNIASGCPLFCPVSKMEAKNSYVRDDAIFIKAIVDLTGL